MGLFGTEYTYLRSWPHKGKGYDPQGGYRGAPRRDRAHGPLISVKNHPTEGKISVGWFCYNKKHPEGCKKDKEITLDLLTNHFKDQGLFHKAGGFNHWLTSILIIFYLS